MNEVRDMLKLAAELIIISVLFVIVFMFTAQARQTETARTSETANLTQLAVYREWQRYAGSISGADMLDFIARHKNVCDIVIRKSSWNAEVIPYLTGNALILGLSDTKNIPDTFWNAEHLYYVLLEGRGESVYEARFLYDGELVSGTGFTITGMEYTEIAP